MFNRSNFNLQRYNLPAEINLDSHIKRSLSVMTQAIAAGGINSRFMLITNSIWSTACTGTIGVLLAAVMHETISAYGSGSIFYYARQVLTGAFSANAHLSLNDFLEAAMSVILNAAGSLGINVHSARIFSAAFKESALVAKTYRMLPITFAAIFDAQATTHEFDIRYTNIAITLLPGEILIIDGDNYTVMHGGQNVISAHTGSWPAISRDAYDIQITSGTGTLENLDATILYTERYL